MGHELDILKAFVMNGETYEVDIIWEGTRPMFKANDIGTVLGLVNIHATLQTYDEDEVVLVMYKSRGGHGGPQRQTFLTYAGVRRLLAKSRKPAAGRLAKTFGMVVHEHKYVCVEAAALDFLLQALEGLKMDLQFSVGGYRIDLYFPEHRLAVECDEEGAHGPGRVSQDRERQLFIESELKCTFVRFRPQRQGFSMPCLLNSVLRGLLLL